MGLASCKKNSSNESQDTVKNMVNLEVDKDFGWSASREGELVVHLDNPLNVSTELEVLQLLNEEGVVLDHEVIHDNMAVFNLKLPEDATHYIYFPVTTDKVQISSGKEMTIELGPTVEYIYPSLKSTNSASCTVCGTPFENGGGELPYFNSGWQLFHENDVPGWETTASDNMIEKWADGFLGVNAQEGHHFFELNANEVAALYQSLCLEPGSTIQWSVWHRGRNGVDVAEVKMGASVATAVSQAIMSDGNNAWGHYSGTYTIPAGQTETVFVFESVSAAGGNQSIGNLLDNFEISCDADGDGVIDPEDDYPNDPDRAYMSFFPENGKQIVAFEDLWPFMGDYDFNDLVLSNKVVIAKNAANELVDASFIVSIDAIGASYENGLAMMVYDENQEIIVSDIIAGISGDASLDPDNTNGLILTESVFETTGYNYQNNGEGPTATPDTLRFTISFTGSETDFIPELYLFRTYDRGIEVHRSGFPETATVNTSLFNTADDAGDYKTVIGLPWGMEIITNSSWKNPIEKIEILSAYPKFEAWATSNGVNEPTWYLEPVEGKVVDLP